MNEPLNFVIGVEGRPVWKWLSLDVKRRKGLLLREIANSTPVGPDHRQKL